MPRATKAMALTESLRLTKQPRWPATSPMTAVRTPMAVMEARKARYPWYKAACKKGKRIRVSHKLVVYNTIKVQKAYM